jgi:hypothetical protein
MLGSTRNIFAVNSTIFGAAITPYIDSDQQHKENKPLRSALWPLIRLVRIKCGARALSKGTILVDLPGVADANAARSAIAKEYMKKCNRIWIAAPITR